MNEVVLGLPTFAFVVGTRVALGVGVGLLVSERLSADRRRVIGGSLVALGAAATIPAMMAVFRHVRPSEPALNAIHHDDRFVGATRFPRKGDDDII